ncbi:hypothetical protein [Haloarchaeobius litoreus]|uniref:Ig-like domain-containing protein n=1 Tax=Haloarchaeobius litoreus TaxID=755306 RepID=A0ABD6DRG3_9EURY|nr:hypothetical protein [Haloarchaeobius litoreus]
MRRRTLLHGAALGSVVGLAGCTDLLAPDNAEWANDLRVENERDDPATVEILVEREAGEQVASERVDLGPDGEWELEDLVEFGTYDLIISVDGGEPVQKSWSASGCTQTTVVAVPGGVEFGYVTC